ncbi:MAG: 3'-5' exonuclease [Rickettsiales bacterium]
MHKTLLVFDIETVVDTKAARNLLNDYESAEELIEEKLANYHLQITDGKNSFARQLFHKVVAISYLEAAILPGENGTEVYEIKELKSGGELDFTEEQLIKGFFDKLNRNLPRLVTFNGKTFDLPVLKYRAMLYDIPCRGLHRSGDKWNSYSNRYSMDWHCDLIEAFSDYGASAKVKMNEVCALFGIPGKLDVDGSQVSVMFKEGKLKEIRDYCELDVTSTYLLYLKYQLHTGYLTKGNYDKAVDDLTLFLSERVDTKANFVLFLEAWERLAA